MHTDMTIQGFTPKCQWSSRTFDLKGVPRETLGLLLINARKNLEASIAATGGASRETVLLADASMLKLIRNPEAFCDREDVTEILPPQTFNAYTGEPK